MAFEITSAYGSVGLSFGIPGQVYSLSGGMTNLGKCVIIGIMWLGKHRGLPSSKDEVIDFEMLKYCSACRYDQYEFNEEQRLMKDIKAKVPVDESLVNTASEMKEKASDEDTIIVE